MRKTSFGDALIVSHAHEWLGFGLAFAGNDWCRSRQLSCLRQDGCTGCASSPQRPRSMAAKETPKSLRLVGLHRRAFAAESALHPLGISAAACRAL
eukprot:s39_g1.t1